MSGTEEFYHPNFWKPITEKPLGWLQDLERGSKVIVEWCVFGPTQRKVVEVIKSDLNEIIISNGLRFNVNTGAVIGQYADWKILPRLIEPAPEMIQKVETEDRRIQLAGKLDREVWSRFPLLMLERIALLIDGHDTGRRRDGMATHNAETGTLEHAQN